MPTYRYSGPHDTTPHEVVAESYEIDRDGKTVAFVNLTSFDGETRERQTLGVIIEGDVETVT